MFATILALAAATPTVIDAERAFAQMAQDKGQWTAFRAYAAPDAVMFTPQPVNAQEFLKPLKDPPKAVRWWPIKAWVSCDGSLAVDTGGAVWPDGHFSRYTTVWKRQPDGGLKWVYDNGADEPDPLSETAAPAVVRSCGATMPPPSLVPGAAELHGGRASDETLAWRSITRPDGSHELELFVSEGGRIVMALHNEIPAPTKK